MAVDWDAIQKAGKQLEDNMKNAHNEINEMSFEAYSDNQLIHANMMGSFDIQSLEVNQDKLDTNMPPEQLAHCIAEACANAVDHVVKKIRDYSKEKIAGLASTFDKSLANESEKDAS